METIMGREGQGKKLTDSELMTALRGSAAVNAALEQQRKDATAERKRLVGQLAELERDWLARAPKLRAAHEAAEKAAAPYCGFSIAGTAILPREGAPGRDLVVEASRLAAERIQASFAFDAARDEIVAKLRASAPPIIGEFIAEMRDDLDRIRGEAVIVDAEVPHKSPITGRAIPGKVKTNLAAKMLRTFAVKRAIEDAEALALTVDVDAIPGKLDELRAGLPSDQVMRRPPKNGGSLLLSDLASMPEAAALKLNDCDE
jgi:hypothetical protein